MRADSLTAPAGVRSWARAITSGYIAAVSMLFTFMLAYGLAFALAGVRLADRRNVDVFRDWFYGLAHNPLIDLAGANLYVVAGLHFAVALLWALVYAIGAEPHLSGPGWLRGATFSLVPWLVSILVVLPLGGGGILGAELKAGPLPLLGNLVLHLAYGATLGALYGPLSDIPADSFPRTGAVDDAETRWRTELRTAIGIILGVLLGLVASVAIDLSRNTPPGGLVLGVPQAAFVLGAVLLGGAVGGFLGSFAGLSPGSAEG